MQEIKFFNVKWTFKDKHLQQSQHLKLYIYIWKVAMYFTNKFFI